MKYKLERLNVTVKYDNGLKNEVTYYNDIHDDIEEVLKKLPYYSTFKDRKCKVERTEIGYSYVRADGG